MLPDIDRARNWEMQNYKFANINADEITHVLLILRRLKCDDKNMASYFLSASSKNPDFW